MSVPLQWFRWLNASAVAVFGNPVTELRSESLEPVAIDRSYGERLSAVTQVRDRSAVRVGWLFVAGQVRGPGPGDRFQKVFMPLLSAEVRISRPPVSGLALIHRVGDIELTYLIRDRRVAHDLESRMEWGGGGLAHSPAEIAPALLARMPRLRRFALDAAAAAGFDAREVVPATTDPESFMNRFGVVVVAGIALYTDDPTLTDLSRAGTLRYWAEEGDLNVPTALHAIYGSSQLATDAELMNLRLPTRLSPMQERAVGSSRTNPLTVISGAPGTGKSHTLAAIALDAVGREENVLVVAKTEATVDALIDLLQRSPGPEPVVFGSNERRVALAARLASGAVQPVSSLRVHQAEEEADRRWRHLDTLRDAMARRLRVDEELALGAVIDDDADLLAAQRRAGVLRTLLDQLDRQTGWLARWRAKRVRKELRGALGPNYANVADVREAALAEEARLGARQLLAGGPMSLESQWKELASADADARRAEAAYLSIACRSEHRVDAGAISAVSALASALRSGRAARRDQLRRLRQADATRALPLWIGTLADVDDLLPPQPGFFDLVILDEAAFIDQPLAAPALLRGKRGVIAGDVRQLRQVSFLADDAMAAAFAEEGLADDPVLCARLDVRRNSVLDLAFGAAVPIVLDEHFRSDPHLIEFVAKRLYGGELTVATRRPTTQAVDCIEVVRCEGGRDTGGVVRAEVEAVLATIRRFRKGSTGIGVVTPFRAQAKAIEEAVLAAFSADELEAMDLRVGTVHGFQGNERDVVIASLGVGEQNAGAWRFVEDPSLAAVMLTRARRRLVVVYAGDPPAGGLMADFIAQENSPPGGPQASEPGSDWARAVRDGLALAGIPSTPAYPSGRHTVDLALDDPERDIAIECDIHPDGVQSHIRRRLELMERRWTFEEALRSQWLGRDTEMVVQLVDRLRASSRHRSASE